MNNSDTTTRAIGRGPVAVKMDPGNDAIAGFAAALDRAKAVEGLRRVHVQLERELRLARQQLLENGIGTDVPDAPRDSEKVRALEGGISKLFRALEAISKLLAAPGTNQEIEALSIASAAIQGVKGAPPAA